MVTFAVDLAHAGAEIASLIHKVASGGEVLITQDGKPVARLIAASQTPAERKPGSAQGMFTVPDDFDAPLDDFRDYQ